MRGRLLAPTVVLLVVTMVLAASDWPTRNTASFWEIHPLLAGVVSGSLVLAIGSLLLDRWLLQRASSRWDIAKGIAFKELGFAADELACGLQELLGGEPDACGRRRANGPARDRCVERAAEYGDALSGLPPEDHPARLGVLLADSDWVAAAVDAIDGLKHAHRHELARWAPVLLTTEELADILNESAQMNERLFELQASLRRLRNRPPIDPDLAANEDICAARCKWQQVLFEAVLLQERLMEAAVDRAWQHHAGRKRLTSDEVDRLERTHDELGPITRPRGIPRADRADVARGTA